MLISSEGDEQLAQYVNRADLAALACSAFLLVSLVVFVAAIRYLLIKKCPYRLVLNVLATLALMASVVAYYAAFIQFNTWLVNAAVRHRFAVARLALDQHAREAFTASTAERARHAIDDPREFICVYPGWLVRALPLALVPSTLFAVSRIRRRSSPAA